MLADTDGRTPRDGANRRRFLKSLGALGVTGLAGCGGDADESTEPADTTEETGTTEGTETGEFLVTDLQLSADDEIVDVSATIENTRSGTDLQVIEYRIGGESLASESLELDGGREESITFSGVDLAEFEAGQHPHGVYSEDDSATGTVTIEPPAAPDRSWEITRHTVDELTSDGLVAVDVTGTGNEDLVVAGDVTGQVAWYRNPGDPRGDWEKHLVEDGYAELEGTEAGDIDGDGRVEVFSLDQQGANAQKVRIHEPVSDDPTGDWSTTVLDDDAPFVMNAFVTDVTGDGENTDLLYTVEGGSPGEGGVFWLEYHDGDVMDASNWTERTVAPVDGAWGIHYEWVDISADGEEADLVLGARSLRNDGADGGVFWLERPDDPTDTPWPVHWISQGKGRLHLAVGDFTGNGTSLDVATSYDWDEGTGVHIYEYPGATKFQNRVADLVEWERRELTTDGQWWNVRTHNWTGGDYDQILTIENGNGDPLEIWDNEDGSGYERMASHDYGKSDDNVAFVDLTGDGSMEMATASESGSNKVDWWEITHPDVRRQVHTGDSEG